MLTGLCFLRDGVRCLIVACVFCFNSCWFVVSMESHCHAMVTTATFTDKC